MFSIGSQVKRGLKARIFKTVIICLLLILLSGNAALAQETTLPPLQKKAIFMVNHNVVQVDDAAFTIDASPYIEKGRTFIPLRYLGEVIGAEVKWDGGSKEATLKLQNGKVLILKSGEIFLNNNGKYELMDVAPVIVPPGRICLPARYVYEAAGYNVVWDKDTQQVTVRRK